MRHTVKTKRLGDYISRWEQLWPGSSTNKHRRSWAKTKKVLDMVRAFVEELGAIRCQTFDSASYVWGGDRDISPTISPAVSDGNLTAIVALSYTLSEVAIKLYKLERNA